MRAGRHEPDLAALGMWIKNRRLALGLTQVELAERLGWCQERISVLEHGKYGLPSLPILAALAEALETPQWELLQAAGYLDDVPAPLPVQPAKRARDGQAGYGDLFAQIQRLQVLVTTTHDQLQMAGELRTEMNVRRTNVNNLIRHIHQVVEGQSGGAVG